MHTSITPIEKRSDEIQLALDTYVERWNQKRKVPITLREGAGQDISNVYFDLKKATFEQIMPPGKKINVFKVCSGTEVACFACKPIIHEDAFKERELNAMLATELALTLYNEISFERLSADISISNGSTNVILRQVEDMIVQHIDWLALSNIKRENINSAPVMLNAQVWQLVTILLKDIYR